MRNYFQYYNIQPAIELDDSNLRKKYIEKSRALHPDVNRVDDDLNNLEVLSAENNRAYETLRNYLSRVLHAIECVWGPVEESAMPKDAAFLMEMMEYNEEVENAHHSADEMELKKCASKLNLLKAENLKEAQYIIQKFDQGVHNDEVRISLLKFYMRLKYFSRLEKFIAHQEPEL